MNFQITLRGSALVSLRGLETGQYHPLNTGRDELEAIAAELHSSSDSNDSNSSNTPSPWAVAIIADLTEEAGASALVNVALHPAASARFASHMLAAA